MSYLPQPGKVLQGLMAFRSTAVSFSTASLTFRWRWWVGLDPWAVRQMGRHRSLEPNVSTNCRNKPRLNSNYRLL
jgi:hypothetical protein